MRRENGNNHVPYQLDDNDNVHINFSEFSLDYSNRCARQVDILGFSLKYSDDSVPRMDEILLTHAAVPFARVFYENGKTERHLLLDSRLYVSDSVSVRIPRY